MLMMLHMRRKLRDGGGAMTLSPRLAQCGGWGGLMCSQAAGSSRVGQEPSDTEPVKRQDRREVGAPESVMRHDGGGKQDACAIFAEKRYSKVKVLVVGAGDQLVSIVPV